MNVNGYCTSNCYICSSGLAAKEGYNEEAVKVYSNFSHRGVDEDATRREECLECSITSHTKQSKHFLHCVLRLRKCGFRVRTDIRLHHSLLRTAEISKVWRALEAIGGGRALEECLGFLRDSWTYSFDLNSQSRETLLLRCVILQILLFIFLRHYTFARIL